MAEQAKTTEYVVLTGIAEGHAAIWHVHGLYQASNDKQAIRLAIQSGADGEQYAAVPSRSWTPRTPSVDTTPTVKF